MSEPAETTVRILLAEDDNDMRRFLVKALQNAGYSVASFDNGLSAYNRLREEPFELLLTDIVMPEMDGIELARRATELDPEIKVMFITGFAAVALNPDNHGPEGRPGALQAIPPSRSRQRSSAPSEGRLAPRGRHSHLSTPVFWPREINARSVNQQFFAAERRVDLAPRHGKSAPSLILDRSRSKRPRRVSALTPTRPQLPL